MKLVYRFLGFTFLGFFLIFLACKKQDNRYPNVFHYIKIEQLHAENITLKAGKEQQTLKEGDVTTLHNHAIKISFDVTHHKQELINFNFSLFPKAFALSPAPPSTLESLDTLFVITKHDYNDQFLAGDTINNIIEGSINKDFRISLSQFINNQIIRDEEQYFFLNEAPNSSTDLQQFKVIYHLSNGEVLDAVTQKIRIE